MLVYLQVLVLMGVGVLSAEPPVSPWQALNPALATAADFEVSAPTQEEYQDTSYDVQYPEATSQNDTAYVFEDEYYVPELPFKLPFKMDKKQLAVSIKLLKEAVKPILKSKSVKDAVAYIDDSLASYRADFEAQMYVTLFLDSLQEIYEGKETTELNMMVKRLFTDMSDEETARAFGSVWRSYVSPVLASYVYNPVRNYVVSPVRNYIYDPLTNYVSDFADRVGSWMDSSQRPYIDIQYPESYERWSETVSSYANRISDLTAQARQGLEMASRMLELQDEARDCHDCHGGESHYEDQIYSASVQ